MKKLFFVKMLLMAAIVVPFLSLQSCSQNGEPDYSRIRGIWERESLQFFSYDEKGNLVVDNETEYTADDVACRYLDLTDEENCYLYYLDKAYDSETDTYSLYVQQGIYHYTNSSLSFGYVKNDETEKAITPTIFSEYTIVYLDANELVLTCEYAKNKVVTATFNKVAAVPSVK